MRGLESGSAFGRDRRPTHRIHRFVRPRLRERTLPQHPREQKPAEERVNHHRQLGKLRWAAGRHVRGLFKRARDVLDHLTG